MFKKKYLVTFILLTLIIIYFTVPIFAEPDLMEIYEISETGYRSLDGTTVTCKSALRLGDIGTGNSDFTPITATYNEPRLSSQNPSGVRAHKGTDFNSKDASGNGRKLFFVYDKGIVYQIQPQLNSSGYGRYVCVQHQHDQNGTSYYFQSFYAHLKSVNPALSINSQVNSTTNVGVSGGSGSTENTYPIHLHLEFRGASSDKNKITRRYPPTFFYSNLGDYGLNMSFINRTAASSSSVTFRIVSIYQTREKLTPPDKVTFYYKNGNMTSWATAPMTISSDGKFFTADLTPLYGTSNTLKYFVKAYTNSYDGTNYYYSTRPYRYSDGTLPYDAPFIVTKTTAAQLPGTDINNDVDRVAAKSGTFVDAVAPIPDKINNRVSYDFEKKSTVSKKISENVWELIGYDGEVYIIKIKYPNAAPELYPGLEVFIVGNDTKEIINGKRLISVEGDAIRVLDEREE